MGEREREREREIEREIVRTQLNNRKYVADDSNQAWLAMASDDTTLLVTDGAGLVTAFSLQSGQSHCTVATRHDGSVK